jgi:hypothetical protein
MYDASSTTRPEGQVLRIALPYLVTSRYVVFARIPRGAADLKLFGLQWILT